VNCPSLNELPAPPSGRTGWPWTEESARLPDKAVVVGSLPVISVITPSYNQGSYLEETIRSILLQGYPKLEYIVLDGGSQDQSLEILKKYSPWLSYWLSEPDAGQSDAINRGLNKATGQFATWINSDDLLCKNALLSHATEVGFGDCHTVYVGYCVYIDHESLPLSQHRGRVKNLEDLLRVKGVWRSENNQGHIDQPAVLFPRELALSVGGLNDENHFTMDYELWGKLFCAGASFFYTDVQFGMFREHAEQKTYNALQITESLLSTAANLAVTADCLSENARKEILAELNSYLTAYKKDYWTGSGRLGKIGLPRGIVTPIRTLRTRIKAIMARQSHTS
jgi:glycosyltransferase involved in cell wall biosynthesis